MYKYSQEYTSDSVHTVLDIRAYYFTEKPLCDKTSVLSNAVEHLLLISRIIFEQTTCFINKKINSDTASCLVLPGPVVLKAIHIV